MNSKIKIFETNILDGIMTRNKIFYDSNLSQEEINERFKNTRINIGNKYGFDGLKIIQAIQKTESNGVEYKNGKYIVIEDEKLNKDDFWYSKLETDILLIQEKYKGYVVGNQCADCAVIIAEDRKLGVTALAHCGAAYIDRNLPYQIIDALKKEFNSNTNNIYVYIGTYAKKENFIYDMRPNWLKNEEVWKDCYEIKNNKYIIDMGKAIIKQLNKQQIKNIEVSPNDTISNKDYASHYCRIRGNNEKAGQNFVGFYYI